MHKDADACHPANGANVLSGEAWSTVESSSGTPDTLITILGETPSAEQLLTAVGITFEVYSVPWDCSWGTATVCCLTKVSVRYIQLT